MADNRVYKLPRDVLAKMTGNNPQAIKALENIETKALEPAPEIDTTVIIETSVAQSMLSSMVSVPVEPNAYLPVVAWGCHNEIY